MPAIKGCEVESQDPKFGCLKCVGKFYLTKPAVIDPKKPEYQICNSCPWLCLTCTSPKSCQTCMFGNFMTKEGTCDTCSEYGCLKCVGNKDNCLVCSNRWYIEGNSCKKCSIDHCETCSTATTCTSCSFGWKLNKTK